jgi:hypothetical protein
MEIIGVAIIVIIVVIGMFFVMFSGRKKLDTKQDIMDAQLAQAMLNSMLGSETECGNSLYHVIKDCYGRNSLCKNSCQYVHDKVGEIFNGTLEKWGKPYRFYTDRKGERKIILEDRCTQFSEKSSTGLTFISYHSDSIVVSLELCKV